jgi:glycosyltransferase involved in cell wall biosynthesis
MIRIIAIVIPVFREQANLPVLFDRLVSVTSGIPRYKWEYIFVNDGSPDNSLEVLRNIASKNPSVKVLDLSRNFGKEIALTAGVHEIGKAEAVICIDADLQHPPELIPKLINKWEEGAEVVVTIRKTSVNEPFLRKIGSRGFYWLINKFCNFEMVPKTTDFRLYDKKVASAFRHATERERMFRGIMDWMGFRRAYIEFHADERLSGDAGYSYAKLWKLAINSITSFSLWPLRLTGYLGILITLLSGLLLTWMFGCYLVTSQWVYTPLAMVAVANTLLIGIVLMSIGLVALYIGTIHTEVVNRPLYLVREKLNFQKQDCLD